METLDIKINIDNLKVLNKHGQELLITNSIDGCHGKLFFGINELTCEEQEEISRSAVDRYNGRYVSYNVYDTLNLLRQYGCLRFTDDGYNFINTWELESLLAKKLAKENEFKKCNFILVDKLGKELSESEKNKIKEIFNL